MIQVNFKVNLLFIGNYVETMQTLKEQSNGYIPYIPHLVNPVFQFSSQ